MDKPRIFVGSSGKQGKLLQALTRGLEDVAQVEPWTTSFTPGTTTLERLLELAHEVDFAAFAFARDDWTTNTTSASPPTESGQASPRDNVVFEAGLFGGTLGMRRTFILHATGAKLPSDLLGLTCVRYGEATSAAEMRVVNQKLRKAIESEGRVARIEGLWWQFSLTKRSIREPSAVSLCGSRATATVRLSWPAAHGKRMAVCQPDTGAKRRRRRRSLRAFSTIGRENDLGTRTRRSWTGRERSELSPPIARPGTSQLIRTLTRKSTCGRPVFTCAPIRRTWASWTDATIGNAPS